MTLFVQKRIFRVYCFFFCLRSEFVCHQSPTSIVKMTVQLRIFCWMVLFCFVFFTSVQSLIPFSFPAKISRIIFIFRFGIGINMLFSSGSTTQYFPFISFVFIFEMTVCLFALWPNSPEHLRAHANSHPHNCWQTFQPSKHGICAPAPEMQRRR